MRKKTPRGASCDSSASRSARVPLKVTDRGLLMAASSTLPPVAASSAAMSDGAMATAAMRPRPRVGAWAALRA